PGATIRTAPIYETAPVDCAPGTQAFLNTAIELEADILPHDLHAKLKAIETALGRPPLHERNSPRTLDLDILHAGHLVIDDEALTIPHPRLHQRRFVLQPMVDLSPDLRLPNQSKTIAELLTAIDDDPTAVKAFIAPLPNLAALRERKQLGQKVAVLTAYDYPTARLLDEAGIDLILVGDSLGMVVHGLPDTTGVTMDMMVMHTAAVCRAVKRAPVIADLPFASYRTPQEALANARRLMECGAAAVKLEGGVAHLPEVKAIIEAGIPFVGHIGMLPQSVKEEGGYKKKGKTADQIAALLADAKALDEAGACAMVLESIVPEVAKQISDAVKATTIGIGAGGGTDGQVLVTPDLLGSYPWFRPPFAKARADLAGETLRAVREYSREVRRDA
ncbi:MAG: 3-methyl-2-oxobutanoate hydroxymethyltransferase, partial [Verrucomicrobiota bacterium]